MAKNIMKNNERSGKFNKNRNSKHKHDKESQQKNEKFKTGKIGKPHKTKKNKKMKQTFDTNSFSHIRDNTKKKMNNLPIAEGQEDEQEVPKKARELMKLTKEIKANKGKLKKTNKNQVPFKMERGMSRPLPSIPSFVKGKYETERHFMSRVELGTRQVLMRAKLEDQYQIDLSGPSSENKYVDPLTGATFNKKPRSDNRKQRDKERKKKKKESQMEKRLNREGDFSSLKDDVEFGDVAMQPPSLSAKPRKTKQDVKSSTRGLLLHKMVSKSSEANNSTDTKLSSDAKPVVKSLAQRQVGQTVKRKFLSPGEQRISDKERDKAINMYRHMRDKKLKQTLEHTSDT